jgi:hypothetical protein
MIFDSYEKQGGRDTNYNIINLAQNTLNDCNLVDLGYHGDMFTWTNNQIDNSHIKERLDRYCATPNWINRFPRFTNYHLMNYTSDHKPILLVFGTNNDFREDTNTKIKIKRFENSWSQDPDCLQLIKSTWENDDEDLQNKLNSVMDKVHSWGKAKHGNIPSEIKIIQLNSKLLRMTSLLKLLLFRFTSWKTN